MSWLFVIAEEMKPSTIGGRVLNPELFLDLLRPLVKEADFSGDGIHHVTFERVDDLFRLRPFLSAGKGERTEDEARYHVRDGERYLKREHTLPVTGCQACVMTREAYLRFHSSRVNPPSDSKQLPIPPEEATHVLLTVTIMDQTYGKGNVPWVWPVADEV